MAGDAHYREVLRQMQAEFQRAVTALEKQVAALSQHNELLNDELTRTKQQAQRLETEATTTVRQLQEALRSQAQDADTARREAQDREEALSNEVAALKTLFQQEQEYWTRHDRAAQENADRLTQQLAEAKADVFQHHDRNQALRREMHGLQARVEAAVHTSRTFEQRLDVVVQEKQQALQEAEKQVTHYRKKLHEKRAQNKYLTEALVRLQEQRDSQSSNSYDSPDVTMTPVASNSTAVQSSRCVTPASRLASPSTSASSPSSLHKRKEMTESNQGTGSSRRVRKREMGLTLPEEIKATAVGTVGASAASGRCYKSKRVMAASHVATSPTSSSPEISPRGTPPSYKRAPSVATTTPTTASDGNSFNSNNSSLHSVRSLRHVTGRRVSSRNHSGEHADGSPRTSSARGAVTSSTGTSSRTNPTTGRLERELTGLRRKLDACMQSTRNQ